MLPNLESGTATRCRAKCKRSQVQCKNLAAFGTPVCKVHGATRPEARIRGPQHHWYSGKGESIPERKERAAQLKQIKALGKCFVPGKIQVDISHLPETKQLKKLKRELEKAGIPSLSIQPKSIAEQIKDLKAKPKVKRTYTPEQLAKRKIWQKKYDAKRWLETKAAKQEKKRQDELARQLYLKETKR